MRSVDVLIKQYGGVRNMVEHQLRQLIALGPFMPDTESVVALGAMVGLAARTLRRGDTASLRLCAGALQETMSGELDVVVKKLKDCVGLADLLFAVTPAPPPRPEGFV